MPDTEATVSEVGEKRIIAEIVRPLVAKTSNTKSTLDDCASIPTKQGEIFVTTDKIPEDLVAWRKGLMSLSQLGRYLVEVNASDICSMGVRPTELLVNIAVPRDYKISEFSQIYEGISRRCVELGIAIVGGDTKFASNLSLVGIAIGHGIRPGLKRWGANVGDLVFVSGEVGGFGAALRLLIKDRWNSSELSESARSGLETEIVEPKCEIDIADRLGESGLVSSCMDISDGFGQSLVELSLASDVGLTVDLARVPLAEHVKDAIRVLGRSTSDIILGPGLDLKLLGTIQNSQQGVDLCSRLGLTIVGEATASGIELREYGVLLASQKIQGYDQLSDDLFASLKS